MSDEVLVEAGALGDLLRALVAAPAGSREAGEREGEQPGGTKRARHGVRVTPLRR